MQSATVRQPELEAEETLDRMVRMIHRANAFRLSFVKCNHPAQRERMRVALLARLADQRVLEVTLERPIVSLLDELTPCINPADPPDAVCVYGLEASINEQQEASPVLGRLNNDRDLLRRAVAAPLLVWLPDFALDCVVRGAPDFWAWRSGVYEFPTEQALWQGESAAVLALGVSALFSLPLDEKQKERARLEELLRTARSLPRQRKREKNILARLLEQLGLLQYSLGECERASLSFSESLHISQEIGDRQGVAIALNQLARVEHWRENLEAAERLCRESLEIMQELGDRLGAANSLHQLGTLQQWQGNLEEAERLYRESLQIKQEIGNRAGTANSLHNLAMVEHRRGNLTEAERLYRESLEIEQELGNRHGVLISLHQLARVEQMRGDLIEAERLYRESLQISEELGDTLGVALAWGQIGGVEEARSQPRDAVQHYVQGWMLLRKLDSSYADLTGRSLQRIREQVGEEQFQKWLREDLGEVEARKVLEALGE